MLDVKQTLKDAEERMESAILYLDEELAHIRAGRANVAILDAVLQRFNYRDTKLLFTKSVF